MKIGLVLFPNLTQLDLTGPYEVFVRVPDAEVFLVAAQFEPVRSDRGLSILPNTTFADCPALDILCVPDGPGVLNAMIDQNMISFLQKQGATAHYVTSVCTGALVLAAAGLLDGYKATTHWLSIDLLKLFDKVEVINERVVKDRNRLTGGGVTAGIDFGLALVAEIYGEAAAQTIQLSIEYCPQPPFNAGSPSTAPALVLEAVLTKTAEAQAIRKQKILNLLKQSAHTQS